MKTTVTMPVNEYEELKKNSEELKKKHDKNVIYHKQFSGGVYYSEWKVATESETIIAIVKDYEEQIAKLKLINKELDEMADAFKNRIRSLEFDIKYRKPKRRFF